jgi:hypothetical protein
MVLLGTKHTPHTTKTRESRTPSGADSSKRCLTLSREKEIIPLLEDMGLSLDEIPVVSLSVYTPSASLCISPRGARHVRTLHTWGQNPLLHPHIH